MKIGITGHQNIDNPKWVSQQISNILSPQSETIVGITSLAIGADQIFANEVIKHNGVIEAIIPFVDYEEKFTTNESKKEYKRLLSLATKIVTLDKIGTDEEAYYAAGKKIVDLSDMMIAVWNGKPAQGLGGTGDIVNYTKKINKKMIIISPFPD